MKAVEVITAHGHENILAANESTFEITKDSYLTKRGDCIIAVSANKSGADLSDVFKKILKKQGARLSIVVQAGSEKEVVEAWGDPKLTLGNSDDLVVRRSSYVCDRTLAIKADKAANDFSRCLVEKLKNPHQRVDITLTVKDVT